MTTKIHLVIHDPQHNGVIARVLLRGPDGKFERGSEVHQLADGQHIDLHVHAGAMIEIEEGSHPASALAQKGEQT